MILNYFAIITFKDSHKSSVESISVDELGIHLNHIDFKKAGLAPTDLLKIVDLTEKEIKNCIEDLKDRKYIVPEPTPLNIDGIQPNQRAVITSVEFVPHKSWFRFSFEKILPLLGFGLNCVNAAANVVIGIKQMEVAIGNCDSSTADKAIPVAQAIAGNFIGILFYVYFKSGEKLRKIGQYIDQRINGNKPAPLIKTPVVITTSRCRSTSLILMQLGMGLSVLALEVGATISQKGGLIALGDQSEQMGCSMISSDLYNVCENAALLCGLTTGLTMVGGVVSDFAKDIEKRMTPVPRSTTSSLLMELKEIKTETPITTIADKLELETNPTDESYEVVEVEPAHDTLLQEEAIRSDSMMRSAV